MDWYKPEQKSTEPHPVWIGQKSFLRVDAAKRMCNGQEVRLFLGFILVYHGIAWGFVLQCSFRTLPNALNLHL